MDKVRAARDERQALVLSTVLSMRFIAFDRVVERTGLSRMEARKALAALERCGAVARTPDHDGYAATEPVRRALELVADDHERRLRAIILAQ